MSQNVNIEHEMRKSYLEYSLSVIIGRAIPDVRDGLKPVHRRILFAQQELANSYNRPPKKCARIVGDVIGKYHPHGDSAVYDALVRLAQDFSMRDPLEDGQGNFGSIDGDAAAAMRYTEVRMSRLASEFLNDIDKETVDFRPNYDNTLAEPVVLPTKVPNLLLNGSSGIAVGMATNIPPHNLSELSDALLMLIDAPESSVEDLMDVVQGPDFPTGGYVYAGQGLYDAYTTALAARAALTCALLHRYSSSAAQAMTPGCSCHSCTLPSAAAAAAPTRSIPAPGFSGANCRRQNPMAAASRASAAL